MSTVLLVLTASEFSIFGQYFSSRKLTLSNLHSFFEKSTLWKPCYFYLEAPHIDLQTHTRYIDFVGFGTFFFLTVQVNDDIICIISVCPDLVLEK